MELWNSLPDAVRTATIAGGSAVVAIMVAMWWIKRFLYVCPPNHVLIFSGRNRVGGDGRKVGFRVVFGGRAWRVPILEDVQSMSLTNISVPMSVTGAYSEGTDGALGIPLSVHAVANIKVSGNPQQIGNAIERFLGRSRDEVGRVAKETLEGHLRGVLATMTPEEVNEDRLKFARRLTEEAEADLEKLGLHLDTLKIQHVSDDRNYLESIGRKRIAEVLRAAEVAESDAQRAAKEAEAAAEARSAVARTNAQAMVAQKENELRQIQADLDAEARSEEERAVAAGEEATASAEKALQQIRAELEALRLEADVKIPAEIKRMVYELEAAGRAASIAENGRATAAALEEVAKAWSECGGEAMDMVVMQNLEDIYGRVVQAATQLKVRDVSLIDGGDGNTLPAYISAYPKAVGALLDEVNSSLGIDIKQIISGKDGDGDGGGVAETRAPQGGQAW